MICYRALLLNLSFIFLINPIVSQTSTDCDIESSLVDTICNADGSYDLVYSLDTMAIPGIQYITYHNGTVLDTFSYQVNGKLDTITGLSSILTSDTLIIVDYAPHHGIFISELHYDNVGSDTMEGFEITAPAGTDLSGYIIQLYNGNNGKPINPKIELSGTIEDDGAGCGAIFFAKLGIQNGSPDGLALISPDGDVLEFLSYEGSFVAVGGPADGLTSIDIGVKEVGNDPEGESLQLTDAGWQESKANTYNSVNMGLTCPIVEYCADTLIYKVPDCPICMVDITGRDTSICGSSLVDLEKLLVGKERGSLGYGKTFGTYGDAITTLANVTTTTTYYLQDSVSPICIDTARIIITIHEVPNMLGRDTIICRRDSVSLTSLLENPPIGVLRYGVSFGDYPIAGDVKVSPKETTTYFLLDSVESTGCFDTTMLRMTVTGPELEVIPMQINTCPEATFDLGDISLVDKNNVVGTPVLSYFSSAADAADSSNALVSSIVSSSGIYYIRYDIGDCYHTASVEVSIKVCPIPCDIGASLVDTICNADGSYDLVYSLDTTAIPGIQYIVYHNGTVLDTFSYQVNGSHDTLTRFSSVQASDTLIIVDYAPHHGIFISELHYDNVGSDTMEGFEITAPAGTDLSGYIIQLYNGNNGKPINPKIELSGTIEDDGAGCGAIFFAELGIQNGSPDGLALISPDGEVLEFLSYEGSFVAVGGPADGFSSIDIGVEEDGNDPVGESLQLTDAGWQESKANTYNSVNMGLTCPIVEYCADTLIYKVPDCPICVVDITGRDTSICGSSLVDLENLIVGKAQGSLRYGKTFGSFGNAITTLANVTTTTTYYLQDSVSPICIDTARIIITIHEVPNMLGRDTIICRRDSVSLTSLLENLPIGVLQYGVSFGDYPIAGDVKVSPKETTTYFLLDSVEITGCFDTTMLRMTVTGPELEVIRMQINTCPEATFDLGDISLVNKNNVVGTPVLSYFTSAADAADSSNALVSSVVSSSGIYYIRYDIGGCYDTSSVEVSIKVCPIPCDIKTSLVDTICNADGSYDLVYSLDTIAIPGIQYIAYHNGTVIDTFPYQVNGSHDTLTRLSSVQASDTLIIVDYAPHHGIFISEFHYDNVGSDTIEGVEITAPSGTDLSGYIIQLYNGNNGKPINPKIELNGTIGDEGSGCGAIFFAELGIQNGSPDGLALISPDGEVLEFLSYEGSFMADGGPADGLTSIDIGVEEDGNDPVGESLQLTDAGWQESKANTYNYVNMGLTCSIVEYCADTLIYKVPDCPICEADITGRDTSICGSSLVDLSTLLSRRVQSTLEYGDEFGDYSASITQLINVAETTTFYIQDSVSKICIDTARIEITINEIPVLQGRDTSICRGDSIMLGSLLENPSTGMLRYGVSFGEYVTSGNVQVSPNENTTYFLLDSVESSGCFDTTMLTMQVAGPELEVIPMQINTCPEATFDLGDISLVDKNNVTGTPVLSYFTTATDAADSSNALISSVLSSPGRYFIRYDIGGCNDTASVEVSIKVCPIPCDIGASLVDTTCNADGSYDLIYSLDTTAIPGIQYIAYHNGTVLDTFPYQVNGSLDTITGLSSILTSDTFIIVDYAPHHGIFISELHYDNAGSDTNEGIEITAPSGTDLSGYSIQLYNGNNGKPINPKIELSGTIEDDGTGCGAIFFAELRIQNGSPDGLALISPDGDVLEFLSYEGSFMADGGPADGLTSIDIGVEEDGNDSSGESLQLTDEGWQESKANTYNSVNMGLTCPIAEYCADTLIYKVPDCPYLDLAISKTLAPRSSVSPFMIGDTVEYNISIFNQGTAIAYDIIVLDSITEGFLFLPEINPNWEATLPLKTSIKKIEVGGSTTVSIKLEISKDASSTEIWNYAEILSASSESGGSSGFVANNSLKLDHKDSVRLSFCNTNVIPIPIIDDYFVCTEVLDDIVIQPFQVDNSIALHEDFENDGNGSSYFLEEGEFSDGKSDFFTRTDGTNTEIDQKDLLNIQGQYWFGASDIDGERGSDTRTLIFESTDIRGLAQLILSVDLAEDDASNGAEDWDDVPSDKDFVMFDYSIDGEAFKPAIHIRPSIPGAFNSAPKIDSNFDGLGEGIEITNEFSNYEFAIPQIGNRILIKVTISLDDGDEDIAIDNVMLRGSLVKYNFTEITTSGNFLLDEEVKSIRMGFEPQEYEKQILVRSNFNECISDAVIIGITRHPEGEGLPCYGSVNLNIGQDCSIEHLVDEAFYLSDIESAFVRVSFKEHNGRSVPKNELHRYVGKQLLFEVLDTCTRLSCWGNLNVEAKNIPEIRESIDTLSTCIPDMEKVIETDIYKIEERLSNACYASFGQVGYEIEEYRNQCDQTRLIIKYFADFTIKKVKEKAYVHTHTLIIQPIQVMDILLPGSKNLGSLNALTDTIEMLVCEPYGTSPEDIANYWAEIIDPLDKAQNGNVEGIPYAYPYLKMDSTSIKKTVLNRIINEVIYADSLLYIDGKWLEFDVIVKDTVIDTVVTILKFPFYKKFSSGKTCNIDVKFNDFYKNVCYERQKLLRIWSVLDWCNGEIREMQQWIIKDDKLGPEFNVINVDVQFISLDSIYVNGIQTTADNLAIDVNINLDLLIKVIDIVDPLVCEASMPIPIFDQLVDNCTANNDILYEYKIDGYPARVDYEQGVIHGFPQGVSELLIMATDKCGNTSSHKIIIVALDRASAGLICRDKVNVTLIDDYDALDGGQARVYLQDLDLGSTDQCNDFILILGRRLDNNIFCGDSLITFISTEYLEFCCEDIGLDIPISLTFFDAFGNSSICESIIHVESNIETKLYTPHDTLSCYEFEDPSFITYPIIEGVCFNEDSLTYSDNYEEFDRNCGLGVVKRTWSIVGFEDIRYVQRLTIEREADDVFNPYSIQWPKNYNGKEIKEYIVKEWEGDSVCVFWRNPTNHPKCFEYDAVTCLEEDLDKPLWDSPHCGLVQITHKDVVLGNTPSCKKIVRNWTLIDWCSYKPNANNESNIDSIQFVKDRCEGKEYYAYSTVTSRSGVYSYQQVIEVRDSVSPMLYCDDVLYSVNVNCIADLQYELRIEDSGFCGAGSIKYEMNLFNEIGNFISHKKGTSKSNNSVPVAFFDLSIGSYITEILVVDPCNNQSSCHQNIEIIDETPPNLTCATGLTTTLMSDASGVSIWASDYVIKAEDNCGELGFYFKVGDNLVSNLQIGCQDYLDLSDSIWNDTVYAIDKNMNTASCNIHLKIVDTRNVCNDSDSGSSFVSTVSHVRNTEDNLTFSVGQNIPNPFAYVTSIPFSLPESGRVEFRLYDYLGQVVAEQNNIFQSGDNRIIVNSVQSNLRAGLYLYELRYEQEVIINKMLQSR